MDRIRGHRIDYILKAVSNIENSYSIYFKECKKISYYYRCGEWLIKDSYLIYFIFKALLQLSRKKIPYFVFENSIKGAIKAVITVINSQKYKSNSCCQVIRVKNNIRAFYTKGKSPFCVKILLSKVRDITHMQSEIKARNWISGYNVITIPKLIWFDLDFDPPFFIEELIWGEKPAKGKDTARIAGELCPSIWQMYDLFGIKDSKIEDFYNTKELYQKLCKGIHSIPWRDKYGSKEIFLNRAEGVIFSEDYIQCSFAHGDLSIGNIIMSIDGKIYVTDWEQSGVKPIIIDLYTIITQFNESSKYIKTKFEKYFSENKGTSYVPFESQVKFGALIKITKWCQNYSAAPPRKQKGMEGRIEKSLNIIINDEIY